MIFKSLEWVEREIDVEYNLLGSDSLIENQNFHQ